MVGNKGFCLVCVQYSTSEQRKNGLTNTQADGQAQHQQTNMHKVALARYDADAELRRAVLWAEGKRKKAEIARLTFDQLNDNVSAGNAEAASAAVELPAALERLGLARAELTAAEEETQQAMQRAELTALPAEPPADVLTDSQSKRDVLIRNGINPVPVSQASTGTLVFYANEVGVDTKDVKVMSQLECCLQIVHYMRHGRAMLQYEQWYQHEMDKGKLHPDTRMCSDNWGWGAADALDDVCMAELRSRLAASPFIAVSLDDSDDVRKREQMCVYVYLLRDGVRETHMLQLHELPGGAAKAEDIAREALHTLCDGQTGEVLGGRGYGEGGLSFAEFAQRCVGFGSDGAAVMFGAENGALVRLKRVAQHALLLWDPAHRTGLSGRDLEQHGDVKQIKDLFALMAADQNHSAKRTQQRLQQAAAAAVDACAILAAKDIRWLSLQASIMSVLKQYAAVASYYMQRALEADTQAEGIWRYLTDARLLLFSHALMAVLAPVNVACKQFQQRAAGLPDVLHTLDQTKATLQRTCIANAEGASAAAPGSSCGKHFAELVCGERLGVNGNCSVRFWRASVAHLELQLAAAGAELGQDAEVAVLEFGPPGSKQAVVLWETATTAGRRRRRVPLLKERWDSVVAEARMTCRDVAQLMLDSLEQRFPARTQQVFALAAFMSPSYWGLQGGASTKERAAAVSKVDLGALKDSLTELAGLFDSSFVCEVADQTHLIPAKVQVGAAAQRDLDGSDGAGERVLADQLKDEVEVLPGYVKQWPVLGSARGMQNVPWGEFWAGVMVEADFVSACPVICSLVQILTVIPSGSVENERGFSAMNRLADKLRNRLNNAHMNVAVRLCGQKEGMLREYSPQIVEFLRKMLCKAQ